MTSGSRPPGNRSGAGDPSIRRTWWLLALAFVALALASAVRVLQSGSLGDWILLVIVAVAAIAAMAHRNAVVRLESAGRGEAEGFARILRGLSRSVSADAIVAAIMDDLVEATAVDHAVLVRRRSDDRALEATLVSRLAGVPPSTTTLPAADLDARPASEPAPSINGPSELGRGREADHARPIVRRAPGSSTPVAVGPGHAGIGGLEVTSRRDRAERILPRTGFRAGDQLPDRAVALARRALAEGLELLRDIGLPLPERRRRDGRGPASVVLARGSEAAVAQRVADRVRRVFGLANTLTVPLVGDDGVNGAIVLSRRTPEPWEDRTRRILRAAAAETAAALARVDTYREASVRAWTDALTGLPNRRYFDESCGLMSRRRRAGDAVAVLMIDIDRFKGLNDTYGHPVGDEVLKAVAGAIARTVRDHDVPARIGGEEFAVLLRNPGPGVAVEVGERVREAVARLDLGAVGVSGVSVSVGVAEGDHPGEPIDGVVERADRALLRAKRAGRNRVVSDGAPVRA